MILFPKVLCLSLMRHVRLLFNIFSFACLSFYCIYQNVVNVICIVVLVFSSNELTITIMFYCMVSMMLSCRTKQFTGFLLTELLQFAINVCTTMSGSPTVTKLFVTSTIRNFVPYVDHPYHSLFRAMHRHCSDVCRIPELN